MIAGLINLIVWLLIVGILIALVYWVLDAIPVPQPINKIVKVVVIVVCALIVILMLLQLIGVGTGVDMPKLVPR
jgi:glucan phosphoethanolaminetransferase (alkaline phosphatase superfamily)